MEGIQEHKHLEDKIVAEEVDIHMVLSQGNPPTSDVQDARGWVDGAIA